jgi:hypothetical protein
MKGRGSRDWKMGFKRFGERGLGFSVLSFLSFDSIDLIKRPTHTPSSQRKEARGCCFSSPCKCLTHTHTHYNAIYPPCPAQMHPDYTPKKVPHQLKRPHHAASAVATSAVEAMLPSMTAESGTLTRFASGSLSCSSSSSA